MAISREDIHQFYETLELDEVLTDYPINRLANYTPLDSTEKEKLLVRQVAGFKATTKAKTFSPASQPQIEITSSLKLNESGSTSKTKTTNKPTEEIMTSNSTSNNPFSEARKLADKINSIEEFVTTVKSFDGCSLKHTASNTVLFEGQLDAQIMLIGEAPGANEDLQGKPFCGDSGKLLDSFLSTINLSRQHNIIIVNSVFWRPPGNRKPTNEEIAICRPFLEKLIALINPKLLVLVGSVAASSVLNQVAPMNQLRRKFTDYINPYLSENITTTVVFHPSYLLRQPLQKKIYWYDLLNLQEYIANNLDLKFNKLASA